MKFFRRFGRGLSLKIIGVSVLLFVIGYLGYNLLVLQNSVLQISGEKKILDAELIEAQKELDEFKSQDQVKVNVELNEELSNIKNTYISSVSVYEELLKLKDTTDVSQDLDELYTQAIVYLAQKNYSSASATLKILDDQITQKQQELAAEVPVITATAPVNNSPPGSGYSRQSVQTDSGAFLVSIVSADLGSTRVIVDTASSGTCANDCPVLPLADYVSRNGAYAGINGSYFCPASYPSCAGKTNSFDTLLMNKDKTYFNSDNNVYSTNPAVIFGGGYIRFIGAARDWGRDTGIDSMISNYPLLVSGSNIAFGGDDDPKKGSRGNRSFVASRGNNVYIGVVHSATVAESARVMKAMGMENALNLDNGGSTALWSGGYKVGPGRNLPNVVLFVRK